MVLKDMMEIGEIIDETLEYVCPRCGKALYAGDIDEYYNVWCECGLEIKFKISTPLDVLH